MKGLFFISFSFTREMVIVQVSCEQEVLLEHQISKLVDSSNGNQEMKTTQGQRYSDSAKQDILLLRYA